MKLLCLLLFSVTALLSGCASGHHLGSTGKAVARANVANPSLTAPSKKWVVVRHGTHPGTWQQH